MTTMVERQQETKGFRALDTVALFGLFTGLLWLCGAILVPSHPVWVIAVGCALVAAGFHAWVASMIVKALTEALAR